MKVLQSTFSVHSILESKLLEFEQARCDLFETFLVCHGGKHMDIIRIQSVFIYNSNYMKKTITCLINLAFPSPYIRPS